MIRKAALFASLCLLARCAMRSVPPPPVTAPPLPDVSAPKTSDPCVCVPIKPEPDIAGGILAPTTPAERAVVAAFLTAVRVGFDWGEQLPATGRRPGPGLQVVIRAPGLDRGRFRIRRC
jgi:hypothetical protein